MKRAAAIVPLGHRPGLSGRGLLLVLLLCAQLFMPAHVLGHELSMDSASACAICPVGQNLTGVCASAEWQALPDAFVSPPFSIYTRWFSIARVASFRSRAPPPVS
jgi:hypothetical protein